MSRSQASRCFIFFLLFAAAAPAAVQAEKSLYKLGLVLADKQDKRLDGDVLNVATAAFVTSRRFDMVERSQLNAVFTEKDLKGFLGKGDDSLSDVLGLDFLGLVSYIVEAKNVGQKSIWTFTIDVRLVDARTGKIIGSISSERPDFIIAPSTAKEAGRALFQSIREAFPPFGYVVRAADRENIMVDLGADAGLKKGDTLEIVREGEEIIHPVTGEALPAELVVVGELKVLSVSPQLSKCKQGKGEAPLGSTVRLKPKNSILKKAIGAGMNVLDRVTN